MIFSLIYGYFPYFEYITIIILVINVQSLRIISFMSGLLLDLMPIPGVLTPYNLFPLFLHRPAVFGPSFFRIPFPSPLFRACAAIRP